MKIAIFGGSFDPVHNEHINMAVGAKNAFDLDKIIVVPALLPPHRLNDNRLDYQLRFKMLEIAFKPYDFIEVSDFEKQNSGISYSYVTVEHFKNLYPNDELFFMVGTDMLLDFPTWRNPERILSAATLLVTPRTGDDLDGALKEYFKHFQKKPQISVYVGHDVSSTKIKAYFKLGLKISDFVPREVESFIEENGAYSRDYLYEYVAKKLPEKRRRHTANVIVKALSFAKKLHADKTKTEISALLHDCAKYDKIEDYPEFHLDGIVPPQIVHQFLGAYVAKTVLKITDEEILNAIKFHTTGRPQMTQLEKIVFLADLVEEDRNFAGVNEIREAIDRDFDSGFVFAVNEMIKFLKQDNEYIYPMTLECADYYNKLKDC